VCGLVVGSVVVAVGMDFRVIYVRTGCCFVIFQGGG
jgi:hypothetical protein